MDLSEFTTPTEIKEQIATLYCQAEHTRRGRGSDSWILHDKAIILAKSFLRSSGQSYFYHDYGNITLFVCRRGIFEQMDTREATRGNDAMTAGGTDRTTGIDLSKYPRRKKSQNRKKIRGLKLSEIEHLSRLLARRAQTKYRHRGLEKLSFLDRVTLFRRILLQLVFPEGSNRVDFASAAFLPNESSRGEKLPCITWSGATHGPKKYARLHIKGVGKVYIHVLFFYYFGNKQLPEKLCRKNENSPATVVGHNRRNCKCFSPHHLSLKTQSRNTLDGLAHGTIIMPNTVGENNGRCKLTFEQVETIKHEDKRLLWKYRESAYGVRAEQISKIRRGKAWAGDPSKVVSYSWHDGHDAPGTGTPEDPISRARRRTLGRQEVSSIQKLLCGKPHRRKNAGRGGTPRTWSGARDGVLYVLGGPKVTREKCRPGTSTWVDLRGALAEAFGSEQSSSRRPSLNLHELLLRNLRRHTRCALSEARHIDPGSRRWSWSMEDDEKWSLVCVQHERSVQLLRQKLLEWASRHHHKNNDENPPLKKRKISCI